jgi:hypothetical protein
MPKTNASGQVEGMLCCLQVIRFQPGLHVQDHNASYTPPAFPEREEGGSAIPKASSGVEVGLCTAAADEPMRVAFEHPGSATASTSAHVAQLGNVTQAQAHFTAAAAADEPMHEASKEPKASKASVELCKVPGMA